MTPQERTYQNACLAELDPLVGKRIRRLVKDNDNGCFGFETEDGIVVWFLCDAEGNGPGFAEVVPGPHQHTGATT